MTKIQHGKIPDWYNEYSKDYDKFNEDTDNSRITNNTIEKMLKKHKVKTVLDLTCGTGSQLFWLAKRGYTVTGSDISQGMLKVARRKIKQEKMNIKLIHGDMRTLKIGKFDAAITIFNAIGHLTKAGFEKAMRNIYNNLNDGGIYVFDIFNLNYLMNDKNITKLTIDQVRTEGNTKYREIQYSIVDNKGVLISYTTDYMQQNSNKPKISTGIGTLQIYSAQELKDMLNKNGFKVLGQYDLDGSKFSEKKTERIMTIAKKQ